jgi:hypothetical protein
MYGKEWKIRQISVSEKKVQADTHRITLELEMSEHPDKEELLARHRKGDISFDQVLRQLRLPSTFR